jgi:hypothetical protein
MPSGTGTVQYTEIGSGVAAAADAELELTGPELTVPELTGPGVTGLALDVAGGLEAGWDRSCPQLTKPIKLAAVRTPTKYVNFDIGEMIGPHPTKVSVGRCIARVWPSRRRITPSIG